MQNNNPKFLLSKIKEFAQNIPKETIQVNLQKILDQMTKTQMKQLINSELFQMYKETNRIKELPPITEISQNLRYLMQGKKIKVLFASNPIFQEIEKLLSECLQRDPNQISQFCIDWSQREFVLSIPKLSKSTITKDTIYNTQYLSQEKEFFKKFITRTFDTFEDVYGQIEELIKQDAKIEQQESDLLDSHPQQLELEYISRVSQVAHLYDALKNEIGLLLYLCDFYNNAAHHDRKNYLDPELGPDGGLFRYRKTWNAHRHRYINNSSRKALKDYQNEEILSQTIAKINELIMNHKAIRIHDAHYALETAQDRLTDGYFKIIKRDNQIEYIPLEEIDQVLDYLIQFHQEIYTYLQHIIGKHFYETNQHLFPKMELHQWYLWNGVMGFFHFIAQLRNLYNLLKVISESDEIEKINPRK